MSNTETPTLSAVADATEPEVLEAFNLVGNETRLAILLALWECYDRPDAADNAASFSTLFKALDYEDRGNFRYHLRQLEDQCVRRTDDGRYEIRHTGLELVRTVIAGAGLATTQLEPTEIDEGCTHCGAPTAVSYEDGLVLQVCTACDGQMTIPELPDGYLRSTAFHPAGVRDRDPEDLLNAAEVAAARRIESMFRGVCDSCSGPVDAGLDVCGDHDESGICERCGRRDRVLAVFRCTTCKAVRAAPPARLCAFHPSVIAFGHRHDAEVGCPGASGREKLTYDQTMASVDPPTVDITIRADGDELRATFDESASIVDVAE